MAAADRTAEPDALRGELARVADWVARPQRQESHRSAALRSHGNLALPKWDFPPLRRIATVPYFSRTGRLIATPGYDRDEGVLSIYRRSSSLEMSPKGRRSPTSTSRNGSSSRSSLETLRFRRRRPSACPGRASLPIRSGVIDSPLPLDVVDAPTPGTGKGLLAQAMVFVSTGAIRVWSRRRTTTKSFGRPLPPSYSRELGRHDRQRDTKARSGVARGAADSSDMARSPARRSKTSRYPTGRSGS